MAQLDEMNVQATIVAFKARVAAGGQLPMRVELVQHDEALTAHAWRSCALEYLERAEKLKQQKETIHL
jgi:hypothetical protein